MKKKLLLILITLGVTLAPLASAVADSYSVGYYSGGRRNGSSYGYSYRSGGPRYDRYGQRSRSYYRSSYRRGRRRSYYRYYYYQPTYYYRPSCSCCY